MVVAQTQATRMIIRIDDMGFSHAANMACMETYHKGIASSVEVIVPGPWFEEAAKLLNENPGLDVGVHLALTSEWANLKWRPLTHAPSLTDADGYFYPMIWKNDKFPAGTALKEAKWDLKEIEAELRAQIELAKKKIPHISHVSAHMGCTSISDEVNQLMHRLVEAYGLAIIPEDMGVQRVPSWSGAKYTAKEKEKRFIAMLDQLGPGDWLLVEHPGYDGPELETIGHVGYENVAADRAGVTQVLTSKKVKKALQKRNIQVIAYKDL